MWMKHFFFCWITNIPTTSNRYGRHRRPNHIDDVDASRWCWFIVPIMLDDLMVFASILSPSLSLSFALLLKCTVVILSNPVYIYQIRRSATALVPEPILNDLFSLGQL